MVDMKADAKDMLKEVFLRREIVLNYKKAIISIFDKELSQLDALERKIKEQSPSV